MNDGGTAFPVMDDCDGRQVVREFGMSLRDYFAAKALQAIGNNDCSWTDIARGCYAAADAMLAERAKEVAK